ncbi:MAG: hypothetical protein KGL39_39625, partial [Patescibacteria group bacterium]|nr:hypothetical protein [Patescibacteria group bacterium]
MSTELDQTVVGPTNGPDQMARAQDVPNLAMMQEELKYAWYLDRDTYGLTSWKEDIRYARWAGQSTDGLKHREYMGEKAKPYDGAPDARIYLADDITNALVDDQYVAFWGARVKVSPVTAARLDASQAAELRAVIGWMLNGPLHEGLIDDVEFAAQLTNTIGWCALHPFWRKERVLRLQTLTMDDVVQEAVQALQQLMQERVAQAAGAPPAAEDGEMGDLKEAVAHLPAMIQDQTLEDQAMATFMHLFPDFDKADARRVVRELRKTGQTEFPMEVDGPNIPVLR